jgi:hypothetical protein
VQETLDYFRELEQEDPEFFHKIKLDVEHMVECLFWVDGTARHAYIKSYNYLVSFDATYMTNMYDIVRDRSPEYRKEATCDISGNWELGTQISSMKLCLLV